MLEKNCEIAFAMHVYRGSKIIINVVSSLLWHRLACVDPPSNLLSKIQPVLVTILG